MELRDTQARADRHLNTSHLEADLIGHSVRGGAVALVAQGCKSLLFLAAMVVLARLLQPADFGLIAMVATVTAFLAQFRDLGLAMSTVQRADITPAQVSTLFWVNALFGALLAALTVVLAPVLAWFYGEPRLTPIARALAAAILLSGLAVQHQALLRRQMRFRALAAVEVLAMGAGAAAAVTSAWLGARYWALVVLELALAFTTLVGVWMICDWRPSRPARVARVRSLLAFGGHLTGFNLVNYLARNLDNLLIGWRWGPRALGFYAKAYDLLMLPLTLINQPVAGVAISGLSRLQFDLPMFRAYYLRALSLTSVLSMPLAGFLIVMADEVVAVILGKQWSESAGILRLLAISAALQPVVNTAGWLYVATGRTSRMLAWGICATGVMIAAFVVGLPYGPRGVALAYALAVVLIVGPCMRFALAGLPISLADVAGAIWRPAAAAALSAGALYAVNILAVLRLPAWGVVLLGGLVMAALYTGILVGVLPMRQNYRGMLCELATRQVSNRVP